MPKLTPTPARDDPPDSVGEPLPTGTVTFLFTDIEGSTRLLQKLGEDYARALADHRTLLRAAFAARGGRELRTEGDSFFVVFAGARAAVAAVCDAQRALAAHDWPGGQPLRVRAGLHTAEAFAGPDPYVGLGVHLAARIAAAAHGGQVLLSATTRALLDRPMSGVRLVDLGEHRLKDFDAPQRLFQLVVGGLPAAFPPVRTLDVPEPGLPRPSTPTIGRETEIRAVCERLADSSLRLLTLTGPGGVGKTRLAVEVARRATPAFDGARFVGLASVSDQRDVPAALVRALGARPAQDEAPLASLARHIGGARLLLVLDNLEHVLPAAPLIGELLDACPSLAVLATSREATRLAAERVHELAPLDVADAVALFGDRAAARDPGFTVDASNLPAVEAICERLDGLPLAVQLAAAQVGILTPVELTRRLQLAVLAGGARDAPERHRTVRATIDWSYELLNASERKAFAAMAVFAGGATLSAAERVTGASLDTLASLVDKHLVLRRGDRLVLLEPVREYALERLADEDAWRRLAGWSCDVVHGARHGLHGVDRVPTLATLDAELPNALSGLETALQRGWIGVAIEVARAWTAYWTQTFSREQGLRWIDAVMARSGDLPELLLARAQVAGLRTHERDRTRADLLGALDGFRATDDPLGIAECLSLLAVHEGWTEQFVAASRFIEEAVWQAERAGDDVTIATVLRRGVIAGESYEVMAARARQAIPRLERLGYIDDIVGIASPVGYVGLAAGRAAEARSWFEEGLIAARRLGDAEREAGLQNNLGLADLLEGDTDAARSNLLQALRAVGGPDDPRTPYVPEALLGLAILAARDGDQDRAARLAGAATAQPGVGNAASEDRVWRRLHELLADCSIDDERWRSLERAGAELSPAAAVELGLAGARTT